MLVYLERLLFNFPAAQFISEILPFVSVTVQLAIPLFIIIRPHVVVQGFPVKFGVIKNTAFIF